MLVFPRILLGYRTQNRLHPASTPLTFATNFGIILTLSYWGRYALKQKAR